MVHLDMSYLPDLTTASLAHSIPPVISEPPTLFRKIHMDTMLMPPANKFHCIVQAHCALTSWPEWQPLQKENKKTLRDFIFEEILCRWGGIAEIVTDNGSTFVAATDYLANKYGIHHIRISPYNSRTNGLVETKHFDIREAIMKTCNNEVSCWPYVVPLVFWANQVTIQKSTGHSPFFLAHGIEAVLPFDVAEATYLLPPIEIPASTESLIAYRVKQLQKHPEELRDMPAQVLKTCQQSVAQFIKSHATTIHNYDFQKGSLVLVCSSPIEKELNRKTKTATLDRW